MVDSKMLTVLTKVTVFKLFLLVEAKGETENLSRIVKKGDVCAFGHANKNIIPFLIKEGLIRRDKFDGRSYGLFLTDCGKELAILLRELNNLLD